MGLDYSMKSLLWIAKPMHPQNTVFLTENVHQLSKMEGNNLLSITDGNDFQHHQKETNSIIIISFETLVIHYYVKLYFLHY